ncbi:MAG: histidinol-phosphate transaminase [Candidatus Methanomethylophilaceae archaeon]|jgi:histidinol-phosphate aminotransferase|nr:histidinol-phosphate transaminase [Candidatus Methanomethylophilaceae archaeon]
MKADRGIMRETARGFERYYNPKLNGELRLDTNTNSMGPNPAATRYLSEGRWSLDLYPNTYSDGLREALAELYGLQADNFIAGNGSDEMLDVTFKTFTNWGDRCAVPVPSYTLYDYFVKLNGGSAVEVDLTEDFQLDVDAIVAQKAKIAIMPSPNNPTGNSFRTKDLEEVLSRSEGIVVVDEAYAEYGTESMIRRVEEFDNLIVLRTFSKAYAMAALRVGYAAANAKLAEMMMCVKIPYSLNAVSEGAAIAAVKDQDFIRRSVEAVRRERPVLAAGLRRLGFEPFPSDSNFIMARSPIDHAELVSGLKERGILIRDFGSKRRTENCVRTTVGTAEQNALLLSRIEEVLSQCR